jgi:hypothetical protein
MWNSDFGKTKLKIGVANSRISALWVWLACFGFLPSAYGQITDFSMSARPLNPNVITMGGQTSADITITTGTGFVGPVNLSCAVTPNIMSPPACQISPSSLTATGTATVTVTTTTQTSGAVYSVTITATDAGTSFSPPAQSLSLTVFADFYMSSASFSPNAIPPGGVSASNISITTGYGFVGPVNLSCAVTSTAPNIVSLPVCQISPSSLTATGTAAATVTTTTETSAVAYSVTIAATDAGTLYSPAAQTLSLTVLAVTPQFTVTIQTAVAPSSVPAGSGAEGIVNINPIDGYSSPSNPSNPKENGVTLSCSTVTPLVTIPPYCSFNPPSPPVKGTVATSTLTINTFGPVTTITSLPARRRFYGLWLFPIPALALVGFGAAGGRRSRKAFGLLAFFVLGGMLLLLPACGNSSTSTSTPNGVTPANTYTFAIVGVDANGVISSNSSTTSSVPTVSLTVTAPPSH